MSVVLSVEELPFTPMGCASWFSAKASPDLTDSAARESAVMGPVDSCGRLGSFGFAGVREGQVNHQGYLCWNGLR